MNSLEKIILMQIAEIEDYVKARTGSSYVSSDATDAPTAEPSSGLYSTFTYYLPSLSLPKTSFSIVDAKVQNAKKLVKTLQSLHVRAACVRNEEDIRSILNELSNDISQQIASEKQLFGVFVGPGEYDKKLDYINSMINLLSTDAELKLLSSVSICESRRQKLMIVSSSENKYLPTDIISYLYSQHFAIIKSNLDVSREIIDEQLLNLVNFFKNVGDPNNLMMLNTLNASLNILEKNYASSTDDFVVKFYNQIKLYNTTIAQLLGINKSYLQAASKLQ